MKLRFALITVAVVAGLASGWSALESASSSQPPTTWSNLLFVFFGSALAVMLVLGFQAVIKNNKAFVFGWSFFAIGAVYFFAAGISSLAVSLASTGLQPASLLFLVMACGMAVGLVALKAVFSGRFKNAA